jgi:uncharacterized membrane protein
MAAALALLAAMIMTASGALAAGAVSDAEVLAIAHKHCVASHAAKPMHLAFRQALNGVVLETVADLKKFAPRSAAG